MACNGGIPLEEIPIYMPKSINTNNVSILLLYPSEEIFAFCGADAVGI
jgi:hypothetical protein